MRIIGTIRKTRLRELAQIKPEDRKSSSLYTLFQYVDIIFQIYYILENQKRIVDPQYEITIKHPENTYAYDLASHKHNLDAKTEIAGCLSEKDFIEKKILPALESMPKMSEDVKLVIQTISKDEIDSSPGQAVAIGRLPLQLESIIKAVGLHVQEGGKYSDIEVQYNINNPNNLMPIGNHRTLEFLRAITMPTTTFDDAFRGLSWIPGIDTELGQRFYAIAKAANEAVNNGLRICILDCTDGFYPGYNDNSSRMELFTSPTRGSHRRALADLLEERIKTTKLQDNDQNLVVYPVDADVLIDPTSIKLILELQKREPGFRICHTQYEFIPNETDKRKKIKETRQESVLSLVTFLKKNQSNGVSKDSEAAFVKIIEAVTTNFPEYEFLRDLTLEEVFDTLGNMPKPESPNTLLSYYLLANYYDSTQSQTFGFLRTDLSIFFDTLYDLKNERCSKIKFTPINGSWFYSLGPYRNTTGWHMASDVGEDSDLNDQLNMVEEGSKYCVLPQIIARPINRLRIDSEQGNLILRIENLRESLARGMQPGQIDLKPSFIPINKFGNSDAYDYYFEFLKHILNVRIRHYSQAEVDLLDTSLRETNSDLDLIYATWAIMASIHVDLITKTNRYPNLAKMMQRILLS